MEKKYKKFNSDEILFLAVLGVPALGLALVYTLVTTYLPYFIAGLSSALFTGIIVGAEGLFALLVPFIVGTWSDAVGSKYGRRLPFFYSGLLLAISSIILMPFSSKNLTLLTLELFVFFIGYFTMYEAYYSLFPDYVSNKEKGLSQGIQGAFRSIGLLTAMALGGILIQIWKPLPFLLFPLILLILTIILYFGIRDKIDRNQKRKKIEWYSQWKLIKKSKQIQLWIIANTLWETAVGALRVFVVLYFTHGLKISLSETSGALALVGVSAIFASPIAGYLADRYSHKPIILSAIVLFALGLLIPLVTINKYFIAGILPVAFAAVVLMTLPFSLLMSYLPEEKRHGTGAALFGFCQGLGAIIGPLVTGIAVELLKNADFLTFRETEGYSSVFLVSSFFLFISYPVSVYLFRSNKRKKK